MRSLTQTFVTGELEELRRQGVRVVMVAVREPRNAQPPDGVPTLVLHRPPVGRVRLRLGGSDRRHLGFQPSPGAMAGCDLAQS